MDMRAIKVLWAYTCTPQKTTQETPYNLTYGTETMIPVEVGKPTVRRQMFDLTLNEESLSAKFERKHASFEWQDATTRRSDRGASINETSSGE